jgi:hypothetical protein
MLTVFKLLLALLVAALAWAYYAVVFPPVVAAVVALVLALVLGLAAITERIPWRLLVAGGPVIATWPAGALLASWVASFAGWDLRRELAIGASWALPLIAHKIESAIAEKRDRARDVGGIALAAICLYLVVYLSLVRVDLAATAVAALGVAAATMTTREHLLIGPESRLVLGLTAAVAAAAAGLLAIRAYVG